MSDCIFMISVNFIKKISNTTIIIDGPSCLVPISLTYLERQKCYGPDKKILFKKQLFDLEKYRILGCNIGNFRQI